MSATTSARGPWPRGAQPPQDDGLQSERGRNKGFGAPRDRTPAAWEP
ncbi:hypothetical protein ACFYPZ_10435 [Streptomyces sp. NPDC005506]